MNKSELIQALSEKSDIAPELARSVVETMIGMMKRKRLIDCILPRRKDMVF